MKSVRLLKTGPGSPSPLGAAAGNGGYNFAAAVPEGSTASLLLYRKGKKEVFQEIPISSDMMTGEIGAVFVEGVSPEKYEYNYQIDGVIIQDACAAAIVGREKFGAPWDEENPHTVRCALCVPPKMETAPLEIPYEDSLIYKLHVRGFTMGRNSKVRKKGTFEGLKEKISYLKELGVTAVELMPPYEFEEIPNPVHTRKEKYPAAAEVQEKINFWGYEKGCYFAPKASYCASGNPVQEFASLVDELHKNHLECIVEFYFPAEINPLYAMDVLHYWQKVYRIDGFHLMGEGAPLQLAAGDPLLRRTKLFGIGFDTDHIYQGKKPKSRNLAEYNLAFQNTMRRYLKGDEGMLEEAAARIRRNPAACGVINYMAEHDGFTMYDMVSYESKHNEENGEENRDGSDMNFTWNCGAEGESRKAAVRKLRMKQLKNAFLFLMLSQGTPLIYSGDELGNTQSGNNNAYCQDNPIGWNDWNKSKWNQQLFAFVKDAAAFRREHPILHGTQELHISDYRSKGIPDLSYHGEKAWFPDFTYRQRAIGVMYNGAYQGEKDEIIYVAYNMYWEPLPFALPSLGEKQSWRCAVNTEEEQSFRPAEEAEKLSPNTKSIEVPARTIVILIGE